MFAALRIGVPVALALGAAIAAIVAKYMEDKKRQKENAHVVPTNRACEVCHRYFSNKSSCGHTCCPDCAKYEALLETCWRCHQEKILCAICQEKHPTDIALKCCKRRFRFICLQAYIRAKERWKEPLTCPYCEAQLEHHEDPDLNMVLKCCKKRCNFKCLQAYYIERQICDEPLTCPYCEAQLEHHEDPDNCNKQNTSQKQHTLEKCYCCTDTLHNLFTCGHTLCPNCRGNRKVEWLCPKCERDNKCGICGDEHPTNMVLECCKKRFSFKCLQAYVIVRHMCEEPLTCPYCEVQLKNYDDPEPELGVGVVTQSSSRRPRGLLDRLAEAVQRAI